MVVKASDVAALQGIALRIREHVLRMAAGPVGAHVGGSFSAAEILAVLYFHVLRVRPEEPDWEGRDDFILSKGHAGAGLYAALAERGFLPVEELVTYARPGGRLLSHPTPKVPGVEFPTGSLGHGLSLGVGLALAAQRDGRGNRTYVLLGDGELQEGSVWEAVMAGAQFGLDNLIAIVDRNGLQINGWTEERMRLEPLADRWRSFGWSVETVDGHDVEALLAAFARIPFEPRRPSMLLAQTVKGKGVKFLADKKKCHYVTLSPDLYRRALNELHQGVKR
jgi:transketolase